MKNVLKSITELGVYSTPYVGENIDGVKYSSVHFNVAVLEVGKRFVSKDKLQELANKEFIDLMRYYDEIRSDDYSKIEADSMPIINTIIEAPFVAKIFYNSATRDIVLCYHEYIKGSFDVLMLHLVENITLKICDYNALTLNIKRSLSNYNIQTIKNNNVLDYSLIHLRRVVPCEIIEPKFSEVKE